MATAFGVPVVSVKVVIDSAETPMTIGQTVNVTPVGDGAEPISGKLVGIELVAKQNTDWEKAIYDGVPTNGYVNPTCGLIRNAADIYAVDAILLEMDDPEDEGDKVIHVRVNISDIKTVEATGGEDEEEEGAGVGG